MAKKSKKENPFLGRWRIAALEVQLETRGGRQGIASPFWAAGPRSSRPALRRRSRPGTPSPNHRRWLHTDRQRAPGKRRLVTACSSPSPWDRAARGF